ncbi:lytic transglycosylase domain-containing protein [Paracoccus sp. (in: a-proteobacteria)]|uniref:lytic transglycosylase domain-containing protein n=1 Tax=Paracoccus sp. TaxID=267 RepID=UPI00289C3190|nr:lytic transglycosylase domain-containing protein [Paracoccus sp. (in: a-proteobacteria)]
MSGKIRKIARFGTISALFLALALPASAEGLRLSAKAGKSRAAQFERQTRLMDSRLAGQYNKSSRLRPATASTKSGDELEFAAVVPAYKGSRRSQYLPHARAMAKKHGVPEDIFLRLVQQESGWNPNARSHKGAHGLAQLMPGTAAKLGVDPSDPKQNLEGGARYLRMMYNTFGSWQLALAAYNAGPGAVAKYGGIPPYRETTNYVRIVHGR